MCSLLKTILPCQRSNSETDLILISNPEVYDFCIIEDLNNFSFAVKKHVDFLAYSCHFLARSNLIITFFGLVEFV